MHISPPKYALAVRQIPDLTLDFTAADWNKIGDWFFMEENYKQAAMAYGKTLAVPPTNEGQMITKYALAKYHIGDLDSCRWAINEVFLLEPGNAFATHVEGLLFGAQEDWEASELALLESLVGMPEQPDFRLNLAYLYQILGRFAEAQIQYEEVIKRDPTHLRARFFRSMALLTQGQYVEGFKEYETRYSMLPLVPQVGKPIWRGAEDLTGKVIVLCAEQGLGDAIQFARYGKWLKNACMAARVIILARPEYVQILSCVYGIDQVISDIKDAGEFDYLAPLMSMPGLSIFGSNPDSVPWYGDCPYMSIAGPDYHLNSDKLQVGFCWQGNRLHANDRFRSMKRSFLAPLLECDIFALNLQHDEPTPEGMSSVPISSIVELAQRINKLDLVITVDTAVAHLAGALNKETWLLTALNPDWRWTAEGDSTPWYPEMRIFRQKKPLDWAPVIYEVKRELLAKISN